MTDDTRDELLMAVARALIAGHPVGPDTVSYMIPFENLREIEAAFAQAQRERANPLEAR